MLKEKYISEAQMKEEPKKKLVLKIKEGSITPEHLSQRVVDEVITPMIEDSVEEYKEIAETIATSGMTPEDKAKLNALPTAEELETQYLKKDEETKSDWNATTGAGQILNKPSIISSGGTTTISDSSAVEVRTGEELSLGLYNPNKSAEVTINPMGVRITTPNNKDFTYNGNKVATTNQIPAYLSQLSNDKGFITMTPVNEAISDALADTVWNKEQTLSEAQKQQVRDNIGVGAADNEDIQNVSGALKLADKAYNASAHSGLGRKYLRKNIVSNKNVLTQAMVNNPNTIYHIQYDYDLNGQTITLPAGCVLEFEGGSFSNGIIEGNNTLICYTSPFIGSECLINGCVTAYGINRDFEIFKSVTFSQREIEQLISFSRIGVKTIFTKGVFTNISNIVISNDVDLDFNDGTINLAVNADGISPTFLKMDYAAEAESFTFTKIALRNVHVKGGDTQYFSVESDEKNEYQYDRHPCIQIFNVRDVELDGVDIYNYLNGAKNALNPDYRLRWENHVVAIMWYQNCIIHNSSVSWCCSEGIKLVPKTTENNSALIEGNYFHDYYFTPIHLNDGRVKFINNVISNGVCTYAHLHCYDSEIAYNRFLNGTNTSHIFLALNENGSYYARNVKIHHNTFDGSLGGINIVGQYIDVHDNIYDGEAVFLYTYSYSATNESHPNSQTPDDNKSRDVTIAQNNIIGMGVALLRYVDGANINRNKSEVIDATIRGVQVELLGCFGAIIQNNDFVGTGKNGITSYLSFFSITNTGNAGTIIVKGNSFSGTGSAIIMAQNGGSPLIFDAISIIDNNSANLIQFFNITYMLEIRKILSKGNMNISFNGISNDNIYENDANGLVNETTMLLYNGVWIKKSQSAYIEDTTRLLKVICTKAGIFASQRGNSTYYAKGRIFKPSDGSVCVCTSSGTTAATEPDYSLIALDGTTTDGSVSVKKIATSAAELKADTGQVLNFAPSTDYLQNGIMRTSPFGLLYYNGTNWTDTKGLVIPPATYDAEVEYLQTTGTQYLSILFDVTRLTTRIILDANVVANGRNLFSLGDDANTLYFQARLYTTETQYRWWSNADIISGGFLNARHTFSLGNEFIVDGVSQGTTTITRPDITRNKINIFKGTYGFNLGYIYGLKVYFEEVLVIDAIPVRKNGEGYLYDKIHGILYGNEGTGSFTLGNDVTP